MGKHFTSVLILLLKGPDKIAKTPAPQTSYPHWDGYLTYSRMLTAVEGRSPPANEPLPLRRANKEGPGCLSAFVLCLSPDLTGLVLPDVPPRLSEMPATILTLFKASISLYA